MEPGFQGFYMQPPVEREPTVECLMCDGVRPEANRKFMMLGVYGDQVIFNEATWNAGQNTIALAFVCLLKGFGPLIRAKWEIESPRGDVLSGGAIDAVGTAANVAQLIIGWAPAVLSELGTYKFLLSVENWKSRYEKTFSVSISPEKMG